MAGGDKLMLSGPGPCMVTGCSRQSGSTCEFVRLGVSRGLRARARERKRERARLQLKCMRPRVRVTRELVGSDKRAHVTVQAPVVLLAGASQTLVLLKLAPAATPEPASGAAGVQWNCRPVRAPPDRATHPL